MENFSKDEMKFQERIESEEEFRDKCNNEFLKNGFKKINIEKSKNGEPGYI